MGSSRLHRVVALVVTRSTYTVMPSPLLGMLGVASQWTAVFDLAEGSQVERSMAEVRFQIDALERTTICVFGPPDSAPVLGAYTLEGFGLEVDASGQKLVAKRLFLV